MPASRARTVTRQILDTFDLSPPVPVRQRAKYISLQSLGCCNLHPILGIIESLQRIQCQFVVVARVEPLNNAVSDPRKQGDEP